MPEISFADLLSPILPEDLNREIRVDHQSPLLRVPQVGFDRNQTLRRLLDLSESPPRMVRRDPAAVHVWEGENLTRPASVEGWIESCASRYPLEGIREFWEGIWNLSVCAWNYIDLLGREPWEKPGMGFPCLTPAFWQGFSRYRRLFDPLDAYIEECGLAAEQSFRRWIQGQVEFHYGRPYSTVPLGMAALALNAPLESGWVPSSTLRSHHESPPSRLSGGMGWSVDFEFSIPHLQAWVPICLCQREAWEESFWGGAVAFVCGEGKGRGYFRLKAEMDRRTVIDLIGQGLEGVLPSGWGSLQEPTLCPVGRTIPPTAAERESVTVEIDWPWTGWAFSAHRLLDRPPGLPSRQ